MISFAVVAIFILMFLYSNQIIYRESLDILSIEKFFPESLFMCLLFTLFIMIVQNLFTVVPLILVIKLNMSLFGFTYGYMWSVLTSIVASLFTYYIFRKWSINWIIRTPKYSVWLDRIAQGGYLYVFLGRVTPFVPTSIINIAAGLSQISIKHFLISTIVGNGLYFFILALVTQGLLSGELQNSQYAIVVIFLFGYVSYKLWKNNRKKFANNQEGSRMVKRRGK